MAKRMLTIATKDFSFGSCVTTLHPFLKTNGEHYIARVNKFGVHIIKWIRCGGRDNYEWNTLSHEKFNESNDIPTDIKVEIREYLRTNLKEYTGETAHVKIRAINHCYPYIDLQKQSAIFHDGNLVYEVPNEVEKRVVETPRHDYFFEDLPGLQSVEYDLGSLEVPVDVHVFQFLDVNFVTKECVNFKPYNYPCFVQHSPVKFPHYYGLLYQDGKEYERFFNKKDPKELLITVSPGIQLLERQTCYHGNPYNIYPLLKPYEHRFYGKYKDDEGHLHDLYYVDKEEFMEPQYLLNDTDFTAGINYDYISVHKE